MQEMKSQVNEPTLLSCPRPPSSLAAITEEHRQDVSVHMHTMVAICIQQAGGGQVVVVCWVVLICSLTSQSAWVASG